MRSRAGLDGMEKRNFLTLSGLELRPICRPARSQSLYRPSYSDPCVNCLITQEKLYLDQFQTLDRKIRSNVLQNSVWKDVLNIEVTAELRLSSCIWRTIFCGLTTTNNSTTSLKTHQETLQLCILPKRSIYVFGIMLRINKDYTECCRLLGYTDVAEKRHTHLQFRKLAE
jgi:hypothetical protein